MKTIRLTLLGLLALFLTSASYAQNNSRPKLFERFPDQINLNNMTLEQVMNAREGQEITVSFGGGLDFPGVVLSNEQKYHNLQTVLIKSPAFQGSVFSLSRISESDTPVRFSGRIINPDAADGYMVRGNNANQYTLSKISTESVLQDCSYQ